MDTTEAIISDLQQNISNNNGGKASRILKAKLKATKSAKFKAKLKAKFRLFESILQSDLYKCQLLRLRSGN